MSSDLAVIIVNWNVSALLRRCLESLEKSTDISFTSSPARYQGDVTVVDNASTDDSVEMVCSLFPWVRLLTSKVNLGFARANNLILKSRMMEDPPAFFLLLNPDTEVAPDAISRMLDFMVANPEVGVIGPKLLNPDGTVQPSRRRFPSLLTAFLESTIIQWRLWKNNPVLRHYYIADKSDDEIQEVDWLTGACLMVRQEAVEAAGFLDEDFFMYSEELDWCRRIKSLGFKIVYFPYAQVVHHSAQSSEQVKPLQHIRFQRSKILYFRKYFGPFWGLFLHIFLVFNYFILFTEEAIKWLLTRRPEHKRGMESYREILISGLLRGWEE
ncbi:MAG: glycosyltransferase family 2 protein [Anaerolineae bacterium]|nr:glycosyltransferase family 2 protein [Anaerolineae bacterium]MDW8101318.1 glycosyltransferase family 2 protein [Anaerolineae bacterium]